MSDAPQPDDAAEDVPAGNPFVARSPIILGAVAAVVALVALVGWPWQVHIVMQMALAWTSLGLAILAMLAIGRGRRNAGPIVALVLGALGFCFWLAAPEVFGALPAFVYVVTAAVLLGSGFLTGRIDGARQRGVLITAAGVVFFTITTSISRFGA